jgi:hypothetical protein
VREHPEGEHAAVKWLSGGALSFPCEGRFFFPMPPLDALGDRAEQARPWWRLFFAGDAGESLFLFPFSLPYVLLGLGIQWVGIFFC